MTTARTHQFLTTKLNEFLFAFIGDEANGMALTVMSVFARQGKDPWREACQLAELPKPQATERLAQAIARMPSSQWNLAQATEIATRLIGLLPVHPATVASGVSRSTYNWNPFTWINLALIGFFVTVALLMARWL